MSRIRRTVLTLVAALLALPTFLIAGGGTASAARNSRPPTLCVNDVQRQFNSLKHHPEALGFYRRNGAYDPTAGRHYQGVVRLPGEGTPRFLTTRNGNTGTLEPFADDEPGEVNIVELASRDTNGERVRSNRFSLNHWTQDTPPPNEDQVIRSLKFGGEGPFSWLQYRHLGGLQMWGDVAVLGMDRPFYRYDVPEGLIQLIDFSNISDPISVGSFQIPHQASSIGVAPFGDGNRLLLLTTGADGNPVYGYEFLRNGKPTTDLRWNVADSLTMHQLFEFDAAAHEAVGWPTGKQSLQTTNLFRDCNTGELFMLGAYSLTMAGQPTPDASRDRMGLWKVDPTSPVPLSLVTKRQAWCDYNKVSRMCHFAAASGFHVTPGGDLMLYATEHDNDGPLKTVRMAEFSSQDGYDQDRAYRPTAVPGTYTGKPNTRVQLDGTASEPAFAQARVELYDEPNFGGSSLVIDYPDHGKEDYRHLARVDAQNDEASSVRWRIPKGCEAVLFDDKDYTGPRFPLTAGQGGPLSNANLRSFNDDTTSVQFYGDCDGRIVSWSWDLGDNGSPDATGPTPTITAPTGVHKLALTVCSGFGVCDKKVTTLDVTPTGTLPKTTPTLTGTAGSANWFRSAVTVDLVATGTPTPTEIRYSATGADPMAEKAVAGTSAALTIDAQGETVVKFRALSAAGEEAVQTVTVKVDTVAPTATVRMPLEAGRYVTGSQVTVQVDCADATSGVAACPTNGTALDTAGTGARILQVTATDGAGNTSTKTVNYTLAAAPSVDAQLVYVARSDASPGPIQRSNADGSNVVQLAAGGNDPVWSPDGSKVAYVENLNGKRQVVVVNADGGGRTVVTNNTVWNASNPAWSPDGARIVFNGDWVETATPNNIHHQAILSVPSSGGASTVLAASDEVKFDEPVYTRNGANVTFVAGTSLRSIPATGVPAGELGTLLVDGAGYHPANPAWSPDGSTLLFDLWAKEIYTSDLYAWNGSGNPVNLTGTSTAWPLTEPPSAPTESSASFLADGRIVFVQDGNIWMMPAQRGAEKVLLADLPYAVRDLDARGA